MINLQFSRNIVMIIILYVLSLLVITLVYLFTSTLLFQPSGFNAVEINNILPTNFLLGVFTYLGIISRYLYDQMIKSENEHIKVSKLFKEIISRKYLWISLIVSPLILLVTYRSVQDIPDNLAAFLFAYENGFFFNAIIDRKSD